ncbi:MULTISPECIES: hypothetical protein [Enterococcus]|nr:MULTISPECIES: hypothetical protein [Enterococcus]
MVRKKIVLTSNKEAKTFSGLIPSFWICSFDVFAFFSSAPYRLVH